MPCYALLCLAMPCFLVFQISPMYLDVLFQTISLRYTYLRLRIEDFCISISSVAAPSEMAWIAKDKGKESERVRKSQKEHCKHCSAALVCRSRSNAFKPIHLQTSNRIRKFVQHLCSAFHHVQNVLVPIKTMDQGKDSCHVEETKCELFNIQTWRMWLECITW